MDKDRLLRLQTYSPILGNVAYLDNAATAQMSALTRASLELDIKQVRGNPGRGLYQASTDAEESIEHCRKTVAKFVNARSEKEIVFTSGTTESLNMVARWCEDKLSPGDRIVVGLQEHHSNLLPWVEIARRKGAMIVTVEPDESGRITWESMYSAITDRTCVVALSMIGNVYGFQNDMSWIAPMAHKVGALFVVDAAQAAMHTKIDVQKMDCDFLAFSGHKVGAPFGIGVLYGKEEMFQTGTPLNLGGGMVEEFSMHGNITYTYKEPPYRFEAGTRNPFGCIGLTAAIDTLNYIGFDIIKDRERDLTEALLKELDNVHGVHIIGGSGVDEHKSLVSFTLDGVHAHDVAAILAENNVYVRAGKMCAQPLMEHLGVPAVVRASVAFYNAFMDVARFGDALKTVRSTMGVE